MDIGFWGWFIIWLGLFVAIAEFRDWLWRRRRVKSIMKMKPLIPTAWSKDVMSYYKKISTRRQLY